MTVDMRTRLSNSLLVGDIIGMLAFGLASDRIGRRWGIIGCTVLLVGGVALAAAAHGYTVNGMLWMMIVSWSFRWRAYRLAKLVPYGSLLIVLDRPRRSGCRCWR